MIIKLTQIFYNFVGIKGDYFGDFFYYLFPVLSYFPVVICHKSYSIVYPFFT